MKNEVLNKISFYSSSNFLSEPGLHPLAELIVFLSMISTLNSLKQNCYEKSQAKLFGFANKWET